MDATSDTASDFAARRQREQRRSYARRPKKIGDVVAQVMVARGYGREQSSADVEAAWRTAAGDALAAASRPGKLRRGTLEVWLANSLVMQEVSYQKAELLARLEEQLPDAKIRGLRFRVGAVE